MKKGKITDAELKVLEAIWELGDGCRLAEIHSLLDEEKTWKNSTICTLLTRLEKKELISKEKKDVYVYTARMSRDEYTKDEMERMRKLLKGDVKSMFAALCSIDDLSKEDLEEIDAYWKRKKEDLMNE